MRGLRRLGQEAGDAALPGASVYEKLHLLTCVFKTAAEVAVMCGSGNGGGCSSGDSVVLEQCCVVSVLRGISALWYRCCAISMLCEISVVWY